MRILGISAHYHDSAAALVVDGIPVCAVQEERLSRRKNDAAFPIGAIDFCLEEAKLEPEDLDAVVFYEKPMLKLERVLTLALRGFPRTARSFPKAMRNLLGEKLWIKGIIASHLGIPARKILFTEHHQAHAATAFFTAPTRRATSPRCCPRVSPRRSPRGPTCSSRSTTRRSARCGPTARGWA